MKLLAALLATVILASCSSVVSVQPVGSKPVDFKTHKLEGVWADEDREELALVIKDAKTGSMAMFSDVDEEELLIRQTGKTLFANMKDEEDGRYSWVRLRLEGDSLRADLPDPEQFAALIAKDEINGRVLEAEEKLDEDGVLIPNGGITVVLDDPKGEWIKKLIAGKLGKPWAKDNKLELKRVRNLD